MPRRRVPVVKNSTRGDRLRSKRLEKGLSQAEAAAATGIPLSTYSGYERAQLPGGRDYKPEHVRDYARLFGTTVNWLMTGEDKTAVDQRLTIATSAQVDELKDQVKTLTALVAKLLSTK